MATVEKQSEDALVIHERNPYAKAFYMVISLGTAVITGPGAWFLWTDRSGTGNTIAIAAACLFLLGFFGISLHLFGSTLFLRITIRADRKEGRIRREERLWWTKETHNVEVRGANRVVMAEGVPRVVSFGDPPVTVYPILVLREGDDPTPPEKGEPHPREVSAARTPGEGAEIAKAIAEFLEQPVEDLTMSGEHSLLDHTEEIPDLRPAPEGFELRLKPGNTTIVLPRGREQKQMAVAKSAIWVLGFGGLFAVRGGGTIYRRIKDTERDLPPNGCWMLLIVLVYVLVPGLLFLWFHMQRVKITVSSRGVLPRLSKRRPIPFHDITGIAACEETVGTKKKKRRRHVVAFRTKTWIWNIGAGDVEMSREEAEWLRDTLARLIVAYRD